MHELFPHNNNKDLPNLVLHLISNGKGGMEQYGQYTTPNLLALVGPSPLKLTIFRLDLSQKP